MAGVKYVKAIYDFTDPQPGEIPLSIGDVIHITKQINADWLMGTNLVQKNQTGSFPSNYVQPLVLPAVASDQKLFLASRPFDTKVEGDLNFTKGNILLSHVSAMILILAVQNIHFLPMARSLGCPYSKVILHVLRLQACTYYQQDWLFHTFRFFSRLSAYNHT